MVLQNSPLPIEQVDQASNAFDALKLVKSSRPDIILSDIRMPQKNGVQLAQEVHTEYPGLPVILVTGYSDFEYTQAAIHSHVFDYIMKPIEPQKVIGAVTRACRQIEIHNRHERMYALYQEYFRTNYETVRTQFLERLLFLRIPDGDLEKQEAIFGMNYCRFRVVAFRGNLILDENNIKGDYYSMHIVEEKIRQALPDAATYIWGDLLFFLWEVRDSDDFEDNRRLVAFLKNLRHDLQEDCLIHVFAGVSRISDTLSDARSLRKQAAECLACSSGGELDFFLFYEDTIQSSDQILWNMEDDLLALSADVKSGNAEAAHDALHFIFSRLAGKPEEYAKAFYQLVVTNIIFLLHGLKIDAAEIRRLYDPADQTACIDDPTTPAALEHWIEAVCRAVRENYQTSVNAIVEKIKAYITDHYGQSIGLTDASRAVDRNPSYVSRLIKQYTGKSFTMLLTEKRVEEAKTLLQSTDLKINEIAEKTGYVNVRYFGRVFKSVVHMSANDYRSFTADLAE